MASKTCSEGWTNERTARRRALHRCRALDAASAREDLACPHPGASDRTMAHEERLRAAPRGSIHVPGKAHGRLERHRPLRGDAFDPPRRLAYSWRGGSLSNPSHGSALDSVVDWVLTPESGGTRVRMEQSGFAPGNEMAFEAMSSGWPRGLERLEQVAAGA